MKYDIRIGQKDAVIELTRSGQKCQFRMKDEAGRSAEVAQAEPDVYSVLMDGRSYEARVEKGADSLVVVIDGNRFEIEVHDPRQYRHSGARRGAEGRQQVRAPMPGKVVRVMAGEGAAVAAGQALLVVEAMKMQNELRAPKSGRLASLAAREGDTVAAGEVLAIIE